MCEELGKGGAKGPKAMLSTGQQVIFLKVSYQSMPHNSLKNLCDMTSESNRAIVLWNGSVPTFVYRTYKNQQEVLRNFPYEKSI